MRLADIELNNANIAGQLATFFEKLRPLSHMLVDKEINTPNFEREAAILVYDLCEMFSPQKCDALYDVFKTLYNNSKKY